MYSIYFKDNPTLQTVRAYLLSVNTGLVTPYKSEPYGERYWFKCVEPVTMRTIEGNTVHVPTLQVADNICIHIDRFIFDTLQRCRRNMNYPPYDMRQYKESLDIVSVGAQDIFIKEFTRYCERNRLNMEWVAEKENGKALFHLDGLHFTAEPLLGMYLGAECGYLLSDWNIKYMAHVSGEGIYAVEREKVYRCPVMSSFSG